MAFNSLAFCLFLPIVFALHWLAGARRLAWQNRILLVASYCFYGFWDARIVALLAFSTGVDYVVSLRIHASQSAKLRKLLLSLSLAANLGLLGVFKYYDFFSSSLVAAFFQVGIELQARPLNLVLPIGISFYTFQTLGYTIDVYRRRLTPSRDPVAFAAFVSFFPQLVAGPIERANHLLPQFEQLRSFDSKRAVDGLRQMVWGLWKKVVVADNCAVYVDRAFDNPLEAASSTLWLGAFFFFIQIYADFSGYSDIAIGTARLFGVNLRRNFAVPFFSRSVPEFWRRWHISLSAWLRDFVYLPLGANQGGAWLKSRNLLLVFTLVGLWHGANETFVLFGLLHGVYCLPSVLRRRKGRMTAHVAQKGGWPSVSETFQMAGTFTLIMISTVLFRADDLSHALQYYQGMLALDASVSAAMGIDFMSKLIVVTMVLLSVEWATRRDAHALERLGQSAPRLIRWSGYALLLATVGTFAPPQGELFIYFRF